VPELAGISHIDLRSQRFRDPYNIQLELIAEPGT
jgi:hypothetical protein